MATDRFQLTVARRQEFGSAVSRRLRKQGLVPGVIYGAGGPADSFLVDEYQLRRALAVGMNALMDVVVEGGSARHAVVKDYQLHPTQSRLLHIDLQEVRLDRPIQATVAVEAVGSPVGVQRGGLLNVVVRELLVEGLPTLIPERIEIDVSEMEIGDSRTVADLTPPAGVSVLGDPELTVITVSATRAARSEGAAEGEGAEEGEGGAEAEGESAEAEGEAAGDEPGAGDDAE